MTTRHPLRKRHGAGQWLLVLLVAAPVAAAEPGAILRPQAGETVWAGSDVTVQWFMVAPEVEEMELFLSLDWGLSFPLRLTPQMAPGRTSLHWRVPNLPTPAARLRLRVGIAGRGEVEAPPSGVFRIAAETPVVAEPIRFFAGEHWLGHGGDPAPPLPLSLECGGQEAFAAHAQALVAELPRRQNLVSTGAFAEKIVVADVGGISNWPSPPVPRETTPLPLRR